MLQILLGVEYMHSKKIIHRDLKPHNILCFEEDGMRFKLCDFGLSKPYTDQGCQSPRAVTPWYRAPEICLQNPKYTQKSDMWSIGCIFYEMLSYHPLLRDSLDQDNAIIIKLSHIFPEINQYDEVRKITRLPLQKKNYQSKIEILRKKINYSPKLIDEFNQPYIENYPNPGLYEDFLDLLSKLLEFKPEYRITATEAINHKFFSGYQNIIDEVRNEYPLEQEPPQILKIQNIPERRWSSDIILTIFKNSEKYSWYKPRILFQTIDIFDRYLNYLAENHELDQIYTNSPNNEYQGAYLSRYDTYLYLTVCLYVSIKYFSTLEIAISFGELVTDDYRTYDSMKRAEIFERQLLDNILKYSIYRETVYEVADRSNEVLTDQNVEDLLLIFIKITSYSGMTANRLYEIYKTVKSKI